MNARTASYLFATTVSLVAAGGCANDSQPNDGSTTQAIDADNGISMNGISMNGISMNGISMNGISMNGISMNGISMNGTSISAVSILQGGTPPSQIIGSTWPATLTNGQTIQLRVDSISEQGGLYYFDASYLADQGRVPLCGKDTSGADLLAMPVPGLWNLSFGHAGGGSYAASTTQFTAACQGASIAKCVELGYLPWQGYTNQMTSCVRMLRADYCGDGTPYTVNGRTINVYDNVGIQDDVESWSVDAAWGPNGATCVGKKQATRYYQTGAGTPACIASGQLQNDKSCGASFTSGTYLIDETP